MSQEGTRFHEYVCVPDDVEADVGDPTLAAAMRSQAVLAMNIVFHEALFLDPDQHVADSIATAMAERDRESSRWRPAFDQLEAWCAHFRVEPEWLVQAILTDFFNGTRTTTRDAIEECRPSARVCPCPACSGITWDFAPMMQVLREMQSTIFRPPGLL